MTPKEYLEALLKSQTLAEDSDELKALRSHRDDVEEVLRKEFGSLPTIRYAGSYSKRTLIKDSYDLDMACYFPRDDDDAGGTLKQIYENVKAALAKEYAIEAKASALRLRGRDMVNFFIDAVPGRFVDDNASDAFLHQSGVEKERMKTNLDTHISYIKGSGVTDAIKVMKYWRTRHSLSLKTFVLELAVIDILKASMDAIDEQVTAVLEEFRDKADKITVEDPANPTGNDLSGYWNPAIRLILSAYASLTLATIERDGWEGAFGKLPEKPSASRIQGLKAAATTVVAPSRPWGGSPTA